MLQINPSWIKSLYGIQKKYPNPRNVKIIGFFLFHCHNQKKGMA